jgi:hypothetical protein
MMSKALSIMAAVIGLGAVAAPASAAQYVFTFATSTPLFGGAVNGNGVFTTSDVATTVGGQTAFAITSITGSVNGSNIVAPTAASYGNYFTTGSTFLDGSGLRFFTAAGNDIRLFYQDTVSQYRVNTFSPGSSSYVTVTTSPVATAVPEPATWAMMIGGFAAIGGTLRNRRRKATVSFA